MDFFHSDVVDLLQSILTAFYCTNIPYSFSYSLFLWICSSFPFLHTQALIIFFTYLHDQLQVVSWTAGGGAVKSETYEGSKFRDITKFSAVVISTDTYLASELLILHTSPRCLGLMMVAVNWEGKAFHCLNDNFLVTSGSWSIFCGGWCSIFLSRNYLFIPLTCFHSCLVLLIL